MTCTPSLASQDHNSSHGILRTGSGLLPLALSWTDMKDQDKSSANIVYCGIVETISPERDRYLQSEYVWDKTVVVTEPT